MILASFLANIPSCGLSWNTTKMSSSPSCYSKFRVTRRYIELVGPAKPTPHEHKLLSDIDDQQGLRFQVPMIHFYHSVASMKGRDPVKVIKESLAAALVFYYPLAGRLRELPGRKLVVDCTGEGVLFIEADADVKLQDFQEEDFRPPTIPCLDELIYDVPDSSGILNCPLLLVQVTRLTCGGFIFGLRFNHTVCDAFGVHQFMTAISEFARGATSPSILPVWQREIFAARNEPRITHAHHEYDQIHPDNENAIIPQNTFTSRSFFFGPKEISALRNTVALSASEKRYSSFNLVAACIWRCRTIALQFEPSDVVRFLWTIGLRTRVQPPVPAGYYGNAFVYPAAISTAGELVENNIEYAAELLSRIKSLGTKEYVQSVADFMVLKGRPPCSFVRTYVVSDNTRVGFENVDFGWGKAVYGGVAVGEVFPGALSFYVPFQRMNDTAEKGILVPVFLPAPAMERFEEQLRIVLNNEMV